MVSKQEGDTDRIDKYDCADYDGYIREDLTSRVFVDFEVFMKRVLHVPDDWGSRWKSAIDAVKTDAEFNKHHQEYCKLCNTPGIVENVLYQPLMNTANAVLGVLSKFDFDGIPSEPRQYYHVNDPSRIQGGVMSKKNLSPDLILLHQSRAYHDGPMHWANPLHVLEVKPYDNALCEGKNIPRLVVDGKCTIRSFHVLL